MSAGFSPIPIPTRIIFIFHIFLLLFAVFHAFCRSTLNVCHADYNGSMS